MTACMMLALLAASTTPDPLADVAFMAGHWLDAGAGHVSEEVWTEPAGDSMLGMWRYVEGGEVRIFELLALTAGADGVWLRLRHFDPQFVGREARERPVVLKLVEKKPGEAVFEGPELDGSGAVRLTYRRPSPDALLGVLEKPGGRKQEFSFRRKAESR